MRSSGAAVPVDRDVRLSMTTVGALIEELGPVLSTLGVARDETATLRMQFSGAHRRRAADVGDAASVAVGASLVERVRRESRELDIIQMRYEDESAALRRARAALARAHSDFASRSSMIVSQLVTSVQLRPALRGGDTSAAAAAAAVPPRRRETIGEGEWQIVDVFD
jgi:hypothetical protein